MLNLVGLNIGKYYLVIVKSG